MHAPSDARRSEVRRGEGRRGKAREGKGQSLAGANGAHDELLEVRAKGRGGHTGSDLMARAAVLKRGRTPMLARASQPEECRHVGAHSAGRVDEEREAAQVRERRRAAVSARTRHGERVKEPGRREPRAVDDAECLERRR